MKHLSQETIDQFIDEIKPFAPVLSLPKAYSLVKAVESIVDESIPGDIVECGVWKGAMVALAAKVLLFKEDSHRKIWLFDTFKGMTEPSFKDVKIKKTTSAIKKYKSQDKGDYVDWCYSPLSEVKDNMYQTGYPKPNIIFVEGDVQVTLRENLKPNIISLLRLDTDFYESTKCELTELYPYLVKNGYIIIDDYGTWEGQRLAVNEFFALDSHQIHSTSEAGSSLIGRKLIVK